MKTKKTSPKVQEGKTIDLPYAVPYQQHSNIPSQLAIGAAFSERFFFFFFKGLK